MRRLIFTFFFLQVIAVQLVRSQPFVADSFIYSKNTVGAYRIEFYKELVKWAIWNNLSQPLDSDGEFNWISSFWPMELIQFKNDSVKDKIKVAFMNIGQRSYDFQRSLLELIYSNYPENFLRQVDTLMNHTGNPEIFCLCAEYLMKGYLQPEEDSSILHLIDFKIPVDSVEENPLLFQLYRELGYKSQIAFPPLIDLLNKNFLRGQTVLFSFQRPDRDYPGLAIVRKPDGAFVLNPDGSIFNVPQLARSISNLPFYLSNGNTPQGIYRILGFGVSNSQFIGPTQNIQMRLPFEIPVDSFFLKICKDTQWSLCDYSKILPFSWKGYMPIYQSFFAGKAGRNSIIAHGTTIDPGYYLGMPFYPETPSLGCLCSSEIWSTRDGSRIESDQQKLDDAMEEAGNGSGYCVVINLGNEFRAVSIKDILPFIREDLQKNKEK